MNVEFCLFLICSSFLNCDASVSVSICSSYCFHQCKCTVFIVNYLLFGVLVYNRDFIFTFVNVLLLQFSLCDFVFTFC